MRSVLFIVLLLCLSYVHAGPIELQFLHKQYLQLVEQAPDSFAQQKDDFVNQIVDTLKPKEQSSTFKASDLTWFKPTGETTRKSVCLVASSFEGITLNSGIGSFYATLADSLAVSHHVTVLLTAELDAEEQGKFQAKKNSNSNIEFVQLDVSEDVMIEASAPLKTSFFVYSYLKQQSFDMVMFPEWKGVGYLSLVAKKDGIFFENTIFLVGLHGPTAWVAESNRGQLSGELEHEVNFMERKSLEFADAVWAPSLEIYEWVQVNQWTMPANTYLIPLPVVKTVDHSRKSGELINELVFFGRLEARKGLVMFCDAVDMLNAQNINGLKITFLGSAGQEYINNVDVPSYVKERSSRWKFEVNVFTDFNRQQVLEYLAAPQRLAVIPSITDNAPYTVAECLENRIPFVASNIRSIANLVKEKDSKRILVDVNARALSKAMQKMVTDGAYVPSGSSFDDTPLMWNSFVSQIAVTPAQVALETPLVSICLVHYNRPTLLLQAIESIEQQDYTNIEVVLVDDGSDSIEATSLLDHLEAPFALRNWKIVRSSNKYLGAARNAAVKNANGKYVLFLDDDNYLVSNAVSTYVKVAQTTKASILTSAHLVFYGLEPPSTETVPARMWLPVGSSVELGLYKNCFGDANFFVSREVMVALPFTEDRELGFEDYEFHAKAALTEGITQQVIPEPMLWYRFHDDSQMMLSTDMLMNKLRAMRPYAEKLPVITPLLNYLASTAVVSRLASCGDLICNTTTENCANCPSDCFYQCQCPGDPDDRCSGNGECVVANSKRSASGKYAYCKCKGNTVCSTCKDESFGMDNEYADLDTPTSNADTNLLAELADFNVGIMKTDESYRNPVSVCAVQLNDENVNTKDGPTPIGRDVPLTAVEPIAVGDLSPCENAGFFLDIYDAKSQEPGQEYEQSPVLVSWSAQKWLDSKKLSGSARARALKTVIPFYYDRAIGAWNPVTSRCAMSLLEYDLDNEAVLFHFCDFAVDQQFQMYCGSTPSGSSSGSKSTGSVSRSTGKAASKNPTTGKDKSNPTTGKNKSNPTTGKNKSNPTTGKDKNKTTGKDKNKTTGKDNNKTTGKDKNKTTGKKSDSASVSVAPVFTFTEEEPLPSRTVAPPPPVVESMTSSSASAVALNFVLLAFSMLFYFLF